MGLPQAGHRDRRETGGRALNILLCGVGGQGILFVTRVLTDLAVARGWPVMGAETHGMAQRGGSVVSHLKMGQAHVAPMVRKGAADLILGFEEDEGFRYLGFLRPGGRLLIDAGNGKLGGPAVQAYLRAQRIAARTVPAFGLARSLGYPLGANLILLGAAQALGWLPFSRDKMEEVVVRLSRPTLRGSNLRSLRCGCQAIAPEKKGKGHP